MPSDLACLITSGQLFQSLAVSMLKLFEPVFVFALSFQSLIEVGLKTLSFWIWLVLFGSSKHIRKGLTSSIWKKTKEILIPLELFICHPLQ